MNAIIQKEAILEKANPALNLLPWKKLKMSFPANELELAVAVENYKTRMVRHYHVTDELNSLVRRVAKYFKDSKLCAAVVGVSGGIDSAVALAVLDAAREFHEIDVYAETFTFDIYGEVFKPEYVNHMRKCFPDVKWNDGDLTKAFNELSTAVGMSGNRKVSANVTYAMRYLAFFARAQDVGGVTVGTTNNDELSYSGWFGKNSDMMTDVQFLWQYPKCVIIEIAKDLWVPESVINRAPVGDLIDGTSDEHNFGVTYDELTWFANEGKNCTIGEPGFRFLYEKFEKLMALNRVNAHKYAGKELTHFNPVFI